MDVPSCAEDSQSFKMMDSPVLLITFNRPEHTRKVLESILSVSPHDLYVFQDGERPGNERDVLKCAEVREVIRELTGDCNTILHTYFADTNLGCGPGPAAAISWFFQQEDQCIIIEDDAVPHPDFFSYSEELLKRYQNDDRVRAIGSMNVDLHPWGEGSYYFSRMNRNLCAWATWKRAWADFDIRMTGVSRHDLSKALRWYRCGIMEREYWCDRLDEVHRNGCDGKSWDMQFLMSIWLHQGKGVIPNVNLSSNIGTVHDATHAMDAGNIIDNIPTSSILPLKHPASGDIQYEADKQFHSRYFEPFRKHWKWYRIAYYLINKRIKRIVGHEGPWIRRTP